MPMTFNRSFKTELRMRCCRCQHEEVFYSTNPDEEVAKDLLHAILHATAASWRQILVVELNGETDRDNIVCPTCVRNLRDWLDEEVSKP